MRVAPAVIGQVVSRLPLLLRKRHLNITQMPLFQTYFEAKFITIAQTSGCLIVLYYNNLNEKESVSIVPG
jgi:hypothetical protein